VADAGFTGGVLVGAVVTAVTVGPLCWTAAKFDRALVDRRDAWATHKALLGTLWSYGGRVIGLGLAALIVLGLVIAAQHGGSGQASTIPSSPGVSSSTKAR